MNLIIPVISKIIQSFYNGVFSSILIYFFFYSLNFQQPIRLSLMVFGSLATSIIKSKIISNFVDRREVFKSFLVSFIFYLVPLLAFSICHYVQISEGIVYVLIIVIGFFPIDGEDSLIFNRV